MILLVFLFYICDFIFEKIRRIYYEEKTSFIFIYHDWDRKFIIYHLRFSFSLHWYRKILIKSKYKKTGYRYLLNQIV